MTVVDALGRGERVESLDVPLNVPAWLIEPCRGSCWPLSTTTAPP